MSQPKQCAGCRNTARRDSDYCGSCEQQVERQQRIEELQRRLRTEICPDAVMDALDFLLEESKVML